MDWGGGEDIGACGTGGAGTCTCKYDHVKLLAADVPLLPGDEITVCLTSLPGAEPEAYVADDCKLAVYCPGDLDGDLVVGITDFLQLLALWGPCTGCPADLDGDGIVGIVDFLTLLANWGPCV